MSAHPDCECWVYGQLNPLPGSKLDWRILHCYDRKPHCPSEGDMEGQTA